MNRKLIQCAALLGMVALGACEKELTVSNPNSGDTKKVIGTPNDAEALISTYWKRWHAGVWGRPDIEGQVNVMSYMNYSNLANDCHNTSFPPVPTGIVNKPGATCTGEQSNGYFILGEVLRVATNLITEMDRPGADALNLGSTMRNNRARAFAEMLRGLSLGYVALQHDSTSIVVSGQAGDDFGKLVPYTEAMDSAYAAFDRAIALATDPASTGADGFPIPTSWMTSPTTFTGGATGEFVKYIRSYKARFRANVARTPAERAAANWDLIIADAAAGFTADHSVTYSSTVGPSNSWRTQYNEFGSWHQMPPFVIGMADVSGSYAAWVATPLSQRGAGNVGFFMVTPDLRFPQGADRAAQQADFQVSTCQGINQVCKRYFVNRNAGGDQFAGVGAGWSNYDHVRHYSWRTSGTLAGSTARNGPSIMFPKAELDLLQAEGLYRKNGNVPTLAMATLINTTRVAAGLPAITAGDLTAGGAQGTVPGGATNCVPKVPVGPAGTTIACGSIFEAMKYEKRIETAYMTFAPWWLDGRGWGDLAEGVPLYYPVPFGDLQARGTSVEKLYSTAGPGGIAGSAAAKGTYGW
jgi:hypothetical protein